MYAYRSRFHVFILWLGFFSFFFFLLYLVTNKQTEKKDRKRIRRLRLWVTKLTVECCLVWYCKHIHFNNFYERLHDDLNAPDFVLHISYIIKIVTKKKGNLWTQHLEKLKWNDTMRSAVSQAKHTRTQILQFIQLLRHMSVDLCERMFWEWIQDHITFMIELQGPIQTSNQLICHIWCDKVPSK